MRLKYAFINQLSADYSVHARRKFFDLHAANKSQLAEQAQHSIAGLCEVERQVRDMSDEERWRIRQEKASPILATLHGNPP